MPQDSSPDLDYWIDRLHDKDQCIFPTLNDGVKELNGRQRVDVRTPGLGPLNEFCQNHDLKLSTVFQTAWGLVLRSYTGVDDVCFGFREDPSEILPCQMSLTRESGLKHALDTVETTFTRDSNHRTCSVKDMEDVLKLGRTGIFNTIVNYRNTLGPFGSSTCNGQRNDQKMHCHVVHGDSDNGNHEDDTPESQYMIAVDIKLSPKFIWMSLSYRLSDLSKGQAANVASSLEKALSCVLSGAQETVGEQHLFSEHHQRQVNEWNRDRPEWIDLTLHEAIATRVRSQPDAPAIRAWDEEWTYHEMDELSSRLARHLVQIGVKTGMRIPLVFERSGWWVIALLAVSKAGGAFVPVDPTQPVLRLKEILQDIEPQFLLSSSQYSGLLVDSVETTVVVSRAALEELSSKTRSPIPLPKVSSKDVAYVMYTSGSTGHPKGALLQHGGYLPALLHWIENTSLGPGTMALQASSYAWSVCIIETICSLWQGACLCIPSDYSKHDDFTAVFNDMQITWAMLSPSVIKTVQAESVKYLRTLILCGEPVSLEVVSKWTSEKTKVWVGWAATECPALARPDNFTANSDVQNLGPCKAVCRVVEVGNHERQVPVGAVGDIVVHAPWIAAGYLNDPEKTAATFLDRPDWLNGKPSSYGSRWYKVGDLVRQNSDGSLILAGRGDNMVKIRGQRFDMSEVERNLAVDDHIRNSLPILPKVGVCKQRLVAVIALHDFTPKPDEGKDEITILKGSELRKAASWVSKFQEILAKRIPSYMVPSVWIMVKSVPLTITGKIDRVALKRFVEKMDVETYEEICTLGVEREAPTTPMEIRLQKIWAEILGLPLEKVGRNQSFISLGGDSILAMTVGARCRNNMLLLRAQDILRFGTIAEVALHTTPVEDTTRDELVLATQFDSLRGSTKDKLHQVGVMDIANVEDAYPCSPMQQGMLLSKARSTGNYNTSTVFEVRPRSVVALSAERLKDAWQQVVDRHSSLRTFFVESVSQSGSFDQVVLRNYNTAASVVIWDRANIDRTEHAIRMFDGHQPEAYASHQPPHHFTILHTTTGRLFFRMNVEHTLVDGMSIAILVRDLITAYDGNLRLQPTHLYSSYVASLQQIVCSIDNKYWKTYLDGMNPCLLPNLSYSLSREPQRRESRSLSVEIKNPHHLLKFCQSQEMTLSALFRTVWGLILRAFTSSDEVCFGFITSGRDLPVAGIEDIVGTFINMLVCRMNLTETSLLKDIIATAQTDYLSSLPHQHASLAQIQHVLGLYGQRLFNTSMTILKEVPLSSGENPSVDFNTIHQWSPNEYDLDVQVWVSSKTVKMELWYRTEWISNEHARNIASTFSQALDAITDEPDQRVGQLDLFSEHHREQVWDWNARYPDTIHACLHDLVTEQALKRPQEIAVHSWDRDLTFSQLEAYADRLAHYLVSLGVGPEVHVFLCFEKSALAIVAILSVLKAGGVCVSVDPAHPTQRLQRIINDTRPLSCLVSPMHRGVFDREGLINLVPQVVTVEESLFASSRLATVPAGKACPTVGPKNAAFVLFTSGSTGIPKGIVHQHQAIASSLHAHGNAMHVGLDSRTLQFSAFVFDVSITEIFLSLTRGGVLCVPSEDERMNNLESAIVRMSANWAHLTPTVASLLNPEKVPTLKHMALAGEPLKKVNITEWAEKLELVNLYGPAECALATTLRVGLVKDDRPDNIGRAVGLLTWLVEPSNTNRLVPVGGVGEILLEGPNIAREYLKDKDRTLASFIENPTWLQGEKTSPPRRFYRSGDIARYNGDGSIQILGRMDTQVKLYGQRVELGEIEYQLKLNLSNQKLVNLAVVYANSPEHPGGGLLASFLEFEQKASEVDQNQLMVKISQELKTLLVRLDVHLADALPSYMVPSIYVPLNAMPLLTAGKIDRGRLSRIVTQLSTEQVKLYSLSEFQEDKGKPRTRMERALHSLWAQVLNIDGSSIGVYDSLFRLGGDSVVAMRLAAAGREAGITIPVASIFQYPKLSEMAAIAKPLSERTFQELEARYKVRRDMVQHIYPCSPLQEGLIILSSRQADTYVIQRAFRLSFETDVEKFHAAWEAIYKQHAILRTRIIHVEKTIGSMQVVIDGSIRWRSARSLEAYLKEDKSSPIDYGEPLTRYAMVDDHEGKRFFVFTAHHSAFDSQSLSTLFSEVTKAYESLVSLRELTASDTTPYKTFVEHIFNADISAAESFWKDQFSGLNFSTFPKLLANQHPLADHTLDYSMKLPRSVNELGSSVSMIIRAAWALLLAQYSDSPENVVFGMTLDGRDDSQSVPGIATVLGPTIATVPVRIFINTKHTIGDFLEETQAQADAMRPFQHFGLQNIRALSPDAAKACDFQSLLAIQPLRKEGENHPTLLSDYVTTRDASSTYLLLLECQLKENGVDITAQYDQKITSDSQMQRILHQLEHVIKQLLAEDASTKQLREIQFYSPQDAKDMHSWNQSLPPLQDTCVHDVIAKHAALRPGAMAVCSWDENLSYHELDELSTTLAHHLVTAFNIGPESLVPLCFAKSAWAVVAMIAVLKAGGGYVPMDPSHPTSRLQEIVEATRASVILCSPQYEALSRSLAGNSFIVSRKTLSYCKASEGAACTTVKPNNVAYIIFTSGSTGTPKGIVMDHGAFCIAATEHGKRTNLNSESRVIHFSSYAFEACILEVLTALFNGGCVCVAPESERLEGIAKTMRDLHVNWAFFTPSFIRTIRPDQVPDLKTLVLGGEALGADNIEVWVDHCYLVNGYGPSETCVFSVINNNVRRGDTPDLIGSSVAGACWIVDPEDHRKLVPLGCVGELLIEGPTLARGYLNDPDRTNQVFVENPELLSRGLEIHGGRTNGAKANGHPDGHINGKLTNRSTKGTAGHTALNGQSTGRRMYKTGDLVCYDTSGNADGSIRFVGRKDTQVKVRGQRMELGDIEHHMKSNLKSIQHVAVEQVGLEGRENRYLAAFFSLEGQALPPTRGRERQLPMSMSRDLKASIVAVEARLGETLPSYMIPTFYVPLLRMPLLSSGKTNRRELRQIAAQLSEAQISQYSLADGQKRAPNTEREIALVKLWASIIQVSQETKIGLDDSFFRLGGDSIAAMRLTSLAREKKILLTVAEIFKNPRLEDMAASSLSLSGNEDTKMEPFVLLRESANVDELLRKIQRQYQITKEVIEDAFPVTPLQEGLMLLSIKQPGSYMSQITLSLRPDVDINHFKAAWQRTAERNSVLRSRFAHTGSQTIQLVMEESIDWRTGSDLETYRLRDKKVQMELGKPLTRHAIIDAGGDERYFVLTAHHSLYDGWSLMLIMEELDHLFTGGPVKPAAPPYATFIKHLRNIDLDEAKSFWQAQFSNKSLSSFPEPRSVTQATAETSIVKLTEITRPAGSDITLSTVMRAAWALLVARYASTDDVFFGATLMGRNASLPNIERMTGPTITTVPVCVSIDGSQTIDKFLDQVQNQATEMIPFEHTGLQNIKRIGPEAEKACNFQNLLVIQPEGSEDIKSNLWKESALFAKGEMVTLTYALILECRLYKDKVRITAQYRDNIITTSQMQRMVHQFEQVMHKLNDAIPGVRTVNSIEVFSKNDMDEVLEWNKETSVLSNSKDCIHHTIERQAIQRPHAQAVDSWDTSFTYAQLNKLSDKLAHHLSALGLGPNQFVPLCFDKSAWTIVAILAVLKAGGAYLSLDPKYPINRNNHIIQDVEAKVILTGSQHQKLFDPSAYYVLVVDREFIESLSDPKAKQSNFRSPNNAAFIVFTSGSTGEPKGIVMEHGAFCSSSREHSKALLINSESRVMQFAAYSYDVSMGEILTTLMQGGCVCVPSEEDRMSRLATSINALKANWIFLTPTVAGFLQPDEVPGLKVLVLGGEHATADNIKTWSEVLHLINSYGPAECAIWCACTTGLSLDADPASLGKSVGASIWITDATDPNKLAPIGCVGELLVEGPTLAREYLNDVKKTAAAFIENPEWSNDGLGRRRRMYRTGDLVRYGSNGNILFVGRRDTQVKLHGQRIELGEIEHHVMRYSPPGWFPVVDILRFSEGERDAAISAFIQVRKVSNDNPTSGEITLPVTETMNTALNQLRSELEQVLPTHMIPAAYILVRQVPLTAGGKVDRMALRKIGESLTDHQLLPYLLAGQGALRAPSTETERRLQKLWAKVLNMSEDSIGLDSNFLRIGGDSIAAMRLSAIARENGLLLTVKAIFTSPKLDDMGKNTTPISSVQGSETTYTPFSSLRVPDAAAFLEKIIHPQLPSVGEFDEIEDVLPATDYQRWTLGCGQLKTRGYNNYFIFHMRGPADPQRIQSACQQLIDHHPVLRTVFVTHKHQLFQVVLKHVQAEFTQYEALDILGFLQSVLESDMRRPVDLNNPSIRFLLVKQGPDEYRLMMRASHSQYDGISLPILLRDLKAAYLGESFSSSLPYSRFIHGSSRVMKVSDAEAFWRKELKDSTMTNILSHTKPAYRNPVNTSLKQVIQVNSALSGGITFATIFKAAWSLVLAQFSASSDVVFGQISTGRNAPIQGIDQVVGPCMNLLPVRVKIDSASTFRDLLRQVQSQHLDMSPYETLGFQHIIEKCTSWPKWTRFSSILQHTNFNSGMGDVDIWDNIEMKLGSFTPDHDVSDIWIWTGPSDDGFSIDFTYSSEAVSESLAQGMLDKLCDTILKITKNPEASIFSVLSKIQPKFPSSLANEKADRAGNFFHPEYISGGPLESIVEKVCGSVFGDENDKLPVSVTIDTPYFELRGDLIAATQLSMAFCTFNFQVSPEDIIDNPTMRLQAAMLNALNISLFSK
ncbi:hypothetical protein V499_01170 [Pseudogymnoascus sp. VKM F-103]|nr:hypothetical protein V499_01170 [Pseudogymnoascus sp. VKM F-103]